MTQCVTWAQLFLLVSCVMTQPADMTNNSHHEPAASQQRHVTSALISYAKAPSHVPFRAYSADVATSTYDVIMTRQWHVCMSKADCGAGFLLVKEYHM